MDGYTLSISRCSGGDGVEESFKAKIKRREAALDAYDSKDRSEGTINRINTVHSLLSTFMEPFRGVSTKHLDAYLAWFKWCRTFMATDSGTAERTVARQLANGVCRSRIRDMFNILPPYMDYWVASAA